MDEFRGNTSVLVSRMWNSNSRRRSRWTMFISYLLGYMVLEDFEVMIERGNLSCSIAL